MKIEFLIKKIQFQIICDRTSLIYYVFSLERGATGARVGGWGGRGSDKFQSEVQSGRKKFTPRQEIRRGRGVLEMAGKFWITKYMNES